MRRTIGFGEVVLAAMIVMAGSVQASTHWTTGLITKVNLTDGKVIYMEVDNYYVMGPVLKGDEHTYEYKAPNAAGALFLLDGEPVSAQEFFVLGRIFCLYDKAGGLATANSRRDGEMTGHIMTADAATGNGTLRVYAADSELTVLPGTMKKSGPYQLKTVAVKCGPATRCLRDGQPALLAEAFQSFNSVRYLPARPQRVGAFTNPPYVWKPVTAPGASDEGHIFGCYITEVGKGGDATGLQARKGDKWETTSANLRACKFLLDGWRASFEEVVLQGRRVAAWSLGSKNAFCAGLSDQEHHVSGMIKEVRETSLVVTVDVPGGSKDVEVMLQADAVFTLDGKESQRAEAARVGTRVRVLAARPETLEVLTTPFAGKTVEEVSAAMQALQGKATPTPEETATRHAAAKVLVDLASDGDPKGIKAICEAVKAIGSGSDRYLGPLLAVGLFRAGKPEDAALTQEVVDAAAAFIRADQRWYSAYVLRAIKNLGPLAKNALPVLEDETIAEKLGTRECEEVIKAIGKGSGTKSEPARTRKIAPKKSDHVTEEISMELE